MPLARSRVTRICRSAAGAPGADLTDEAASADTIIRFEDQDRTPEVCEFLCGGETRESAPAMRAP